MYPPLHRYAKLAQAMQLDALHEAFFLRHWNGLPFQDNQSVKNNLMLNQTHFTFALNAPSLFFTFRREGLGFDSRAGQIGTVSPAARHRCNVFSELCCPGAKPRR